MKAICAVVLTCALSMIPGCMTVRVKPLPEAKGISPQDSFLVSRIKYDEHGRPLFSNVLGKRPAKAGEQFVLVHTQGGKPVMSYDVLIVPEPGVDMSKPLGVIYEWTGSGFRTGLAITGSFLNGNIHGSGKEAAVELAIVTAPIVIGGVSGFVIGLVASIPDAVSELSKVAVDAREKVVGYTLYEYDDWGRLRSMRLFPPVERSEALVRTEFFYNNGDIVPYKTEVTSRVEQKTRIIR
jgi:hypothetical protein